MRIRKAAAGMAVIALALTGCSGYDENNGHNAPFPSTTSDISPKWQRIDDPSTYATIIWACVGHDGVYIAHDTSSPFVLANDPNCAGK